jgi:hypothetical protein
MTTGAAVWAELTSLLERAINAPPLSKQRADAIYEAWLLSRKMSHSDECGCRCDGGTKRHGAENEQWECEQCQGSVPAASKMPPPR